MADVGNDIDNLRFSIILDDSQFRKKMKETEDLANKFEKSVRDALAITNLLNQAQGGGAQGVKQKAKEQEKVVSLTRQELEAKMAAGAATKKELSQLAALVRASNSLLEEDKKRLDIQKKELDVQDKQERNAQRRKRGERDLGSAISGNTSRLMMQNDIMKEMSSYVMRYASVLGAVSVVRNLVRITGEFEAQHQALRAILQDRAAADEIFNQLKVLAVKSPYTFKDLTSYAKQLTAFSTPVNEVYETTKKLADVSAGLGVDMGRIILAYGQVRSAEFLRGQEVRQFTEAGVPILKDLADQFAEIEGRAISVGEVFDKISKRQVPFAMVEEAFNRMTSAGGKFYNMQEVLAETVKGKVSNLQDAWEIMLSKIGDAHSGTIKGILSGITNLLANYQSWISIVKDLIRLVGLYAAGIAVYNTVIKTTNALAVLKNGYDIISSRHLSARLVMLGSEISLLKAANVAKEKEIALLKTTKTLRQGALGVLSLLLTVAWGVYSRVHQKNEEARKDLDAINSAFGKLQATTLEFNMGASRVEKAFAKMKEAGGNAADKTDAFRKAIDDLKKQFPMFVDDHIKLANSVDELGRSWDEARGKMNQYFADEARSSFHNDIAQQRDESIDKLSKDFSKYIGGLFKDKEAAKINASTAWQYVTGTISRDELGPVLGTLVSAMREKTGNHIEYSGSILTELDGYVKKYNEIIGRYEDAQDRFDSLLHQRGLADTRKVFNEKIYEAFAKRFSNSSFDTGGEKPVAFRDMSGDEQRNLIKSYLDFYDIAFTSEQEADQWAKLMRAKLADGKIPDSVKSVIRSVFDQFKIAVDPNALFGFQKEVKDVIDNFGDVLRKALEERGDMTPEAMDAFVEKHKSAGDGFRAKVTDTIDGYVEARVKDANDVAASMKITPKDFSNLNDEAFAGLWVEDLLLKTISQKLYGEGVSDFSGNTKDAKTEAEERRRRYEEYRRKQAASINQQVSDLKDLKAVYDELRQYVNDETARGILHEIYGDDADKYLKTGKDFKAQLLGLASALEKYDAKAASPIRRDAKKDELRERLDSYKRSEDALKKASEMLGQAEGQMRNLYGKGTGFDVSKILDEQAHKDAKADAQMEKSLKTLADSELAYRQQANEKSWEDYEADGEKTIRALAESQKAANKAEAEESIRDLAQRYVKEKLKGLNGGVALDFGSMSIGALKTLIDGIESLMDDESLSGIFDDIPEDKLESLRGVIGEFKKLVSEQLNPTRTEAVRHYLEEISRLANQIGQQVSGIGSTLSSIGGKGWEGIGAAFSAIGQGIQSYGGIKDALSKLDKNGNLSFAGKASLIASAVENTVKLIGIIGDQISENKRKQEEWNQTIKDCEMEYRKLVLDDMDYQQGNLFGMEDPFQKAKDGAKQYMAAVQELEDMEDDLAKSKMKVKLKDVVSGKNVMSGVGAGAAAGAAIGTAIGGWAMGIGTAIGTAVGAVVGGIATLFGAKKKKYVMQTLEERYGSILEEGTETYELNKRILADYDRMDDATKKLIDNWDEIRQKALDAEAQMKENFSDFVGSMGDDIVDEITKAFRDGDIYQAMDDMHDYMGKIMENILSQQVMSAIFTPMFNELQDRLLKSYKPGEGYDESIIDDLIDFANQLPKGVSLAFDSLKYVRDAMAKEGYRLWEDAGTDELTNGIKGISETQGDLLASYVNGIRADVSLGKTQWERIAVAVEGQSARYVTLNDYLAKVQADTSNIADSNRRILARLEGFIRDFSMSSEYGESLKVQMVN